MRILIIWAESINRYTGGTMHLSGWCHGLKSLGHNIKIVAPRYGRGKSSPIEDVSYIRLPGRCLASFMLLQVGTVVWLPFIAGAIVIGLVVSFTKLPEIATARVVTVWKSGYHMKEAAYARTEMFIWTARRIPEHPILGHGTGAFATDRGGQDERAYPHNIILESLYEQGVVGAVIVGLFLWLIFRRWRQASRFVYLYELDIGIFQIVHMAGLLFLFLFTQAMKSGDINDNRFMFFGAGLVIAAFSLVRRSVEEISLENELIAEDRQYSEGFELQDAQVLY